MDTLFASLFHITKQSKNDIKLEFYIKNNLQKKQRSIHNHAAGLKSLAAKFELQSIPGFSAEETAGAFIVTLPLTEKLLSGYK